MATPKKNTKAAAQTKEAVEPETSATSFGVSDLIDEIEKETGKAYQPATIRILLRKLASEGKIVKAGGRWGFEGADDPAVETIIDAVKNGRAEKEPKAEKEPAAKKPRTKKQAEPEPEEDEDDLEVDIDDL